MASSCIPDEGIDDMPVTDKALRVTGPVNWPDVVSSYTLMYEQRLSSFDDPPHAGGEIGGFVNAVTALAVLRGPDSPTSLIQRVTPSVPRMIRGLPSRVDTDAWLPAAYTLYLLNSTRCCGHALPPEAAGVEDDWLTQLATLANGMNEREQHTLGIAASAASLARLVPSFTGSGPLAERFVPGQMLGFNVPDFAVYIATALVHKASYQDVEPAWLDFVHRFPYTLDTGALSWPALMWAARAVLSTIGQLPEAEVALELHRLVTGA